MSEQAEISAQAIAVLRQVVEMEKAMEAEHQRKCQQEEDEAKEINRAYRIEQQRKAWEAAVGAELLSGMAATFTEFGIVLQYRGECERIDLFKLRPGKMPQEVIYNWIQEVDCTCVAREKSMQAQQVEIQRVVAAFEQVQTADEFREVEIPWDIEGRVEVAEVRDRAWERVRLEEEERQRCWQELQEAAFYPFVYYRVYYPLVATDDGQMYVDQDTIVSLAPEPVNGWWVRADGRPPVQLPHVCMIERIEVRAVDDLPGWCHYQDSVFGSIKVVPVDAERL